MKKGVKRAIFITAMVMFASGVGLILFPIVSNQIGSWISNSAADSFDARADSVVGDEGKTFDQALENGEIDDEGYPIDENGSRTSSEKVVFKADLDRLLKDSEAYNEKLKTDQYDMSGTQGYSASALNLADYGITDGVYGYVTAETINMRLPVYLGASSLNMAYGAAHLNATSLPIGGESTNAVIAGHTGYVGRIFFDNLRGLEKGDPVTFTNYWETLEYKVIKTDVKTSTDGEYLSIEEGKDLLTLFTCISDGKGGYNRYYVICERVE